MLGRYPMNGGVRKGSTALLLLLLALLAGCGGRPMPFPVPESELGDRPGLFTGEKGAWELLPRDNSQPPPR
jgi:hypothetical protein